MSVKLLAIKPKAGDILTFQKVYDVVMAVEYAQKDVSDMRASPTAWKQVTVRCLCAAWRPLWPECVLQRDFEGFEELEEEAVVHEIVSLGNSMGLEVDDDDVEELVEEHSKELSTEELLELHKEENETLKQSLTSEESGEEEDKEESRIIPAKDLKDAFFCWSKLSKLAEDYHPDVGSVQKAISVFNDNVMNYFWKVQKSRRSFCALDMASVEPLGGGGQPAMNGTPPRRPEPPKAKREYRVGKKHAKYSLADKAKVVEYIAKGMKTSEIRRLTDAPESTIRTLKQNKGAIKQQMDIGKKYFGTHKRMSADTSEYCKIIAITEAYLSKWLSRRVKEDASVSGPELREQLE
ncbi:Tigger transposable element-derived protein 1-like 172 [Homarus americanus]|uniref:Tigger transposable element-derived protein 1-like 172 n=1 Tax=Homarus americanus TaxID=6706 RepID=A0A8J5TLU2_HOMAM|nr:Tigger transposable element-derived protein 1-like 172 [Homarus americanus]